MNPPARRVSPSDTLRREGRGVLEKYIALLSTLAGPGSARAGARPRTEELKLKLALGSFLERHYVVLDSLSRQFASDQAEESPFAFAQRHGGRGPSGTRSLLVLELPWLCPDPRPCGICVERARTLALWLVNSLSPASVGERERPSPEEVFLIQGKDAASILDVKPSMLSRWTHGKQLPDGWRRTGLRREDLLRLLERRDKFYSRPRIKELRSKLDKIRQGKERHQERQKNQRAVRASDRARGED